LNRIIRIALLTAMAILFIAIPAVAQEIDGSDPRDPALVYLEIRGDLDETEIVGRGVPTQVYIEDVFTGYSLPVWADPTNVNEELYYSVCVPGRWDESHDIVIEVISCLSNAGEKGNTYQIDIAWDKVTPEVEVVPAGFHSMSAIRYNVSNLQYYTYRDFFVVDYDAPAIDPIISDDHLAFRLRLGQVGGQYQDLDGELIILHVGILFPRGDLLGDPGDILGGDSMNIYLGVLILAAILLIIAGVGLKNIFLAAIAAILWLIAGAYSYITVAAIEGAPFTQLGWACWFVAVLCLFQSGKQYSENKQGIVVDAEDDAPDELSDEDKEEAKEARKEAKHMRVTMKATISPIDQLRAAIRGKRKMRRKTDIRRLK